MVKSGQDRLSQIKSCWGRSNEVMTDQAKLRLVKLDRSSWKIFGPKIVLAEKFFLTQNFWEIYLDQNFVGPKWNFDPKFFFWLLFQTLFLDQNFFLNNFFWTQNFFNPKSFWSPNALELEFDSGALFLFMYFFIYSFIFFY